MSIFMVDWNDSLLNSSVEKIKAIDGVGEVYGMKVDVSDVKQVIAFREKVLDIFGEVRYIHLREHLREWMVAASFPTPVNMWVV